MGFNGTVPHVLRRMMGLDGHVGCKCMGGTHGILWNNATCPTKDNGTGQTCRMQVCRKYPWDSVGQSRLSYVEELDGSET